MNKAMIIAVALLVSQSAFSQMRQAIQIKHTDSGQCLALNQDGTVASIHDLDSDELRALQTCVQQQIAINARSLGKHE